MDSILTENTNRIDRGASYWAIISEGSLLGAMLLALASSFFATNAQGQEVVTMTVSACIDGEDYLIIQGGSVWWEYVDFTPVGIPRSDCASSDTTISTTLNGTVAMSNVSIQPVWNSAPNWPTSGDISQPLLTDLDPALFSSDMNVTLTVLQGRGSLTILRYPDANNGYALILGFNDNLMLGADLYTAQLTITPKVPAYTCDGFEAPFNTPLALSRKTNRAIPLDAQLLDQNGNIVTPLTLNGATPPVVSVDYTSASTPATDETSLLDDLGSSSAGNLFTFDATGNTWWFNLGTSPFTSSGTYTVTMKSGDVTKYILSFQCAGIFTRP